MISTSMAGSKTKPLRAKQNISSLNQQIKEKEKLVQTIINQKQELRQSYIEAMAELRKNANNEPTSFENNQSTFTSTMDRLDNEEESLTLEIKNLSEQRAQLNKNLIDKNASIFIPKKALMIFIGAIVTLGLGYILSINYQLFSQPSPEKSIQE